MKPRRILLIRTDRIGDVALSTPAIKAVRDRYPDAYIAFMVRPCAKDIVEGNPCLDEVIIYEKEGTHKGFFSTLLFALNIRKKRFDTAIILHPTNRAHIIAFAAGIPNRIGWNRKLPFLLTKAVKDEKFLGKKHEFAYTLDILREIGIKTEEGTLSISVKKSDDESINSKLSSMGVLNSDLLIAVHPSASCPSKRWPPERFASLINRLKKSYDLRFVLVSGPEEKAHAARLKGMLECGVLDFSGQTSVGELAALLKKCALFISNDSGPVHIAAAVGTPSVVIFGRKQPGLSPRRWAPTGKDDVVLHKDVDCTVCLAHNCMNGFKCLEAITVDEVFGAVEKLLAKQKN